MLKISVKTGLNWCFIVFKIKCLGLLFLTFFTISITLNVIVSENTSEEGLECLVDTVFYAYGLSTCPYCRLLHEFFNKTFPHNYNFCYINLDYTCEEKHGQLVEKILKMPGSTSVHHFLGYVPLTVVVKNETHIVSIVVGAVIDENFWINLACKKPNGKVYFYQGTELVAVLGEETSERGGIPSEILTGIIAISIPAVAVGGYYLYTYVLSKKTSWAKNFSRFKRIKRNSR